MTNYFVDANGAYLGGFEGAEPPSGAIEVPEAPDDARQIWSGTAWGVVVPLAVSTVLKSTVMGRLTASQMATAYAMLTANPVFFARWFAPDKPFVNVADPDAVGFVKALGLDPIVILAP